MADGTEVIKQTPRRDLAADAARRTAGETFTNDDYEFMLRGVATNTRLALRRQWLYVIRWCGEHGYVECPMPVETCVKLIRAQWTRNGRYGRPYSPESIQQMLWAITKAHKVARRPDGTRGYISPVDSEEVSRAMAAYRRDYVRSGHRPDIATPISREEQMDMVRTCDVRSPIGLRDALALALLYDAGFRSGELVRTDGEHPGLLWQDIEIHVAGPVVGDGDRLVIHVPESKTDQAGFGDQVVLPAHPEEYAFNCPVRLLLAWHALLRERGFEARGPVLRQVFHGGKAPADGRPKKGTIVEAGLAYDGLVRLFMRAVVEAGLTEPEGRRRHFVLHGMRAGAAEEAAEQGADTPELNVHFRWSPRSTTANRYAARGRRNRMNPARRIWARRVVT